MFYVVIYLDEYGNEECREMYKVNYKSLTLLANICAMNGIETEETNDTLYAYIKPEE